MYSVNDREALRYRTTAQSSLSIVPEMLIQLQQDPEWKPIAGCDVLAIDPDSVDC